MTFNNVTLPFDAPQVTFGFFGTDVGDFDGNLSLSFDGATGIAIGHRTGVGDNTDGEAAQITCWPAFQIKSLIT